MDAAAAGPDPIFLIDELELRLGAVAGGPITRSHAGAHFAFYVGGGDVTWDLLAATESAGAALCARVESAGPQDALAALAEADAALRPASEAVGESVARIELARLDRLARHVGRPGRIGVKRTLWLRVEPGTPDDVVRRFEAETLPFRVRCRRSAAGSSRAS